MWRARGIREGLETMSGAETRKRPSSVGKRRILPGPYTIRGAAGSACDSSVGVDLDHDELLRRLAAAVTLPLPAISPRSTSRQLEAVAEGGAIVVESVAATGSSAGDDLAAVFITLNRMEPLPSLSSQTGTFLPIGSVTGASMQMFGSQSKVRRSGKRLLDFRVWWIGPEISPILVGNLRQAKGRICMYFQG